MSAYQEYNQPRPRSRTVLSFGSNKSGGSGGISGGVLPKIGKDELFETSKEKAAKRISTKANPNIALNEVEPVVQALMQPTMNSNLRGMQHKDMFGNVITDPDRSNPTRPRLERPLDTIRSFEAAVDGKYGRVSSYSETPGPSRPASSYFAYNGNQGHGNRSGRPDSYVDSSMYGSANRRSPAPFGGPPRRGFGPANRNASDPVLYGNGMYTQPKREQYQPSYDSVGSSGGSGGTENWNPSTDPSSPNSSVDRFQPPPPPKHDIGEQYGFTGFGGAPPTDLEYQQQQQQLRQQGYQVPYQNQNPQNQYQREEAPPPPPPHKGYVQRTSSNQQHGSLQKAPSYSQPSYSPRPAPAEKRKSWLMRRFSKN